MMGAHVTVCGPPTLIPRGIEALGCEVRYDLDDLREADVVYALRMQNERMDQAFVPSLREYAANYQINGRRLGPRQVLMHPGPVNRGVELSGEVVDSPQAVITMQVKAGVVVRMAVLYEVLAGARDARTGAAPDRAPARMSAAQRSTSTPPALAGDAAIGAARPRARAPRRPARARRRTCSTRARASTAAHDVLVRDGDDRRDRRRRDASPRPSDVEIVDGAGRHLFPAFVDPHVHLRTPGQEHKEDLETGTRSAAAGGYCAIIAMPNTVAGRRLRRRSSARCSTPPRARRACPSASSPAITRGLQGHELTEMAELRALGAAGFTDDGRPVVDAGVFRRALQYQRLCGGVLALHEEDPALSGKGAMHEGAVSARARRRRDPERQRVDDDRPRLRARRVRGRADPHPAPLGARVGRGRRARRRRAASQVTCEASPHHLHDDRRGRPRRSTRAAR